MHFLAVVCLVVVSCCFGSQNLRSAVNFKNSDIRELFFTSKNDTMVSRTPTTVVPAACCGKLSFIVFGDWGKGGITGTYASVERGPLDTEDNQDERELSSELASQSDIKPLAQNKPLYQVHVARAMGKYSQDALQKPSFVVTLGDNFYTNGVSSATDILWSYLWKDIYLKDYKELNIPWYPVFGNHDYGGGASYVQAQLDRYYRHSDDDIWMFEAKNYTKRFQIPGSPATVQIVFIDTTTLAPSINKCCNQNGGISYEVQQMRIQDQLGRIERMLAEATNPEDPATWVLVAGHYPVVSAGGQGDVSELNTYLLPLLEKYKVHAYLCGHDHISEHLQYNGIEYFVAGAGSMTDQLKYTSKATLKWYGVGYSAYSVMDATEQDLTITYRDWNNTVRYTYTLTNPNTIVYPDNDDWRPDLPHEKGDNDDATDDPSSTPPIMETIAQELRKATRSPKVVTISCGIVAAGGLLSFFYVRYLSRRKHAMKDAESQSPSKGTRSGSGGSSVSSSYNSSSSGTSSEEQTPWTQTLTTSDTEGGHGNMLASKLIREDVAKKSPRLARALSGKKVLLPRVKVNSAAVARTRQSMLQRMVLGSYRALEQPSVEDETEEEGENLSPLEKYPMLNNITPEEIMQFTKDGRIFDGKPAFSPLSHRRAATAYM